MDSILEDDGNFYFYIWQFSNMMSDFANWFQSPFKTSPSVEEDEGEEIGDQLTFKEKLQQKKDEMQNNCC